MAARDDPARTAEFAIAWQDNGAFERISSNSQRGSWAPWILYLGGIWALVVAMFIVLPLYLERRRTET